MGFIYSEQNKDVGRTEHKPNLGKLTQKEDTRRGTERHGEHGIMQGSRRMNTEDEHGG